MLGWHNVWMRRHGRELATRLSGVGREVLAGGRPLYALAVVVALAVLREGSEAVLFLHGVAVGADGQHRAMLVGGLLGVAGGLAFGLAMYFGLLRLASRHLFAATAWLIVLVAAGMAAEGARYLVQAGFLPALGNAVWDTSSVVSDHSVAGQVLHVLVGYTARPDGVQLLLYAATIVSIGGLMVLTGGSTRRRVAAGAAAGALTLLVGATGSAIPTDASAATYHVYSPHVEPGELEVEARGYALKGGRGVAEDLRSDTLEVGYGITDWWFSAAVLEGARPYDVRYGHDATAWENIFQLTEPGKYWLDAGVYLEYGVPSDRGEPDNLEAKLLLEKDTGALTHTANLIFERGVGAGAHGGVETGYAWQSRCRLMPEFEPAVEIYGALGETGDLGVNGEHPAELGPVATGRFHLGRGAALRYEAGYLWGLNHSSADGVAKWMLELEVYL
jgi:high-affinity iron transporter